MISLRKLKKNAPSTWSSFCYGVGFWTSLTKEISREFPDKNRYAIEDMCTEIFHSSAQDSIVGMTEFWPTPEDFVRDVAKLCCPNKEGKDKESLIESRELLPFVKARSEAARLAECPPMGGNPRARRRI